MLLFMNNPKKDNFAVDTVITNKIDSSQYKPIESLRARIIIANPKVIDKVKVIDENNIKVFKNKINIIWGDISKINLKILQQKNSLQQYWQLLKKIFRI